MKFYMKENYMILENGKTMCNCTNVDCERFGKCKECIEFHRNNEIKPLAFCKREENQDK